MSAQNRFRPLNGVQEFRNRKTLIIGEVNTGKTAYLAEILNRFLEGGETDLTVMDMAPESVKGIGGKMTMKETKSISYCTTQIVDEVEALAEHNAKLIEGVFTEYVKSPSKVLFINDVSLYLQAGDLHKLLLWINSTPTVIMNGYYGFSLGEGELGKRERQNMKALQKRCDRVIEL